MYYVEIRKVMSQSISLIFCQRMCHREEKATVTERGIELFYRIYYSFSEIKVSGPNFAQFISFKYLWFLPSLGNENNLFLNNAFTLDWRNIVLDSKYIHDDLDDD